MQLRRHRCLAVRIAPKESQAHRSGRTGKHQLAVDELKLRHRHGDVVFSHGEKTAGIDDRVRDGRVERDDDDIDRSDGLIQVIVVAH
jgi:hypothetical protein